MMASVHANVIAYSSAVSLAFQVCSFSWSKNGWVNGGPSCEGSAHFNQSGGLVVTYEK